MGQMKPRGLRMVARSKYAAVRTEVDGHKFASKKEARRYAELKLLERAGKIADLKLQPRIECRVAGYGLVCTYVADFFYIPVSKPSDNFHYLPTYEDVKGFKTPIYKLKKRLVKALTGIDITEV